MRRGKIRVFAAGAVLCVMGTSFTSPALAASAEDFIFESSLTSTDNADGTYDVPLLKSDVPDVSVTRVPADENDEGTDIYYMVSTTMHLSPGAPIMKSYDLVNWEIVNYAYDRLSTGDAFSLRDGKSSYGEGQWATSIRYHDGKTFVLFNTNNLGGAYMLYTDDPENGTWERVQFGRAMHDPTLFFDEANGGDPYVFYGNGNQTAVKLDPEQNWKIVEEYPEIFKQSDYSAEWTKGLFEGSQLAYINGMYYMVMITSGSGWARQVLVLRSPYLLGRYDERSGGENTYEDHSGLNSNGYAQGSLVEVDNGDGTTTWHGFFFRDTYPGGRIPALIPITWPEEGEGTTPEETVTLGENIVDNGSFDECTTDGWQYEYTATLKAIEDDQRGCVLSVSARQNNGSGPSQKIGDKLVAGGTYDFNASFYYDSVSSGEVPESTQFQLLVKGPANVGGLDQYGLLKVGEVSATPGQWVEAGASWTVPEELVGQDIKFVVETPWSADGSSSRIDYLMDDVSIVGHGSNVLADVEWTAQRGGTLTTTENGIRITDREETYSGPHADIKGLLNAGDTYQFSARLRYTDDPDTQKFIFTLCDEGFTGACRGVQQVEATKGEWVDFNQAITVGADYSWALFEVPWKSAGTATADDLVDYEVADISLVKTGAASGGSSDDSWPVFGRNGVVGYPDTFDHLITLDTAESNLARSKAVVTSDDFFNDAGRQPWTYEYERWGLEGDALDEIAYNGSDLRAQWEWNHAPDNRYWSLTDRDGWLRLATPSVVTGEASHRGGGDNAGGLTYLEEARNTLGQRVVFPRMSAETRLDFGNLADGDTAGLAIYHRAFTYAAARNEGGKLTVGLVERTPTDVNNQKTAIDAAEVEAFKESVEVPEGQTDVYLRVDTEGVDGQPMKAWWYYSWDGETWKPLGGQTQTAFGSWQPTHFMGPRVGLFNYATKDVGGYADFDYLYLSDADRTKEVSSARLESAVAYAESLDLTGGSCELGEDVQFWLGQARQALADGVSTHTQADAPVERLQLAMAEFLADDSGQTCTETPEFEGVLSASSVKAGEKIEISGTGATGTVTAFLDDLEIGSGAGDENGEYSFAATIPSTTLSGSHEVTVRDESGATWTAKIQVEPAGELPSGQVAITGTPRVGELLSASVTDWPEGTEFTYQWFASASADGTESSILEGANEQSLRLSEEYAGAWLGVEVTASHPEFSSPRTVASAFVGPIAQASGGGTDGSDNPGEGQSGEPSGDNGSEGSSQEDLASTGVSSVLWLLAAASLLSAGTISIGWLRKRQG